MSLIMEFALPAIEEEDCILANGEVKDPCDQPVSLPTEGKEDGSNENDVSSAEGTLELINAPPLQSRLSSWHTW
eukprot:1592781-Ditylum_brightwellii.AAC.1